MGERDEAGRGVVWPVLAAAVVVVAGLVPAASSGTDGGRSGPTPAPAPSTGPPAPAPTTTTTARSQHPLSVLVDQFARRYAVVAADAGVLGDPQHPAHRQLVELLTPDSPIKPIRVIGYWQPTYPEGWTQVAGSMLPERIPPGEHNADLPLILELLGDLPSPLTGDEITLRTCAHVDHRILLPDGLAWEATFDAKSQGTVTFRRVNDSWLLHTFRINFFEDCQRCGPEPPGAAYLTIDFHADGRITRRPTPLDPPCPVGFPT